MKKLFSISFALLILLSGMHLSISTHFCGGQIAAVRWSLSGEKATCGMENSKSAIPCEKEIMTNCCHNEEASLTVDNNYSPTSFHITDVIKKVSQVYAVPVSLIPYHSTYFSTFYTDVSPPDKTIANAVSLADICVFRI